MSMLWIAVAVLAAAPAEGDVSPGNASSANATTGRATSAEMPKEVQLVAFRTGDELRDAVGEALPRWGRVRPGKAKQAAAEFLVLYREVQADTELTPSVRESLRQHLRNRLLRLSDRIKRRAAYQRRKAEEEGPKTVEKAKQHEVLGQFGFAGPAGQGRPAGLGAQAAWPNAMQAGFGGANRPRNDYGEDLVELIQATIAPKTWDVNGGPGAIYYWRPGRALVVTAPQDVHEEIGDVLQQLEKAGR